jgi:predicted esterase
MPVAQVPLKFQPLRMLAEKGAGHVPEGMLLSNAIKLGSTTFALTPEHVTTLTGGFRSIYARIAEDPDFDNVQSVLGQTVSQDPARGGHYFLYCPSTLAPDARMIVFLHGFGGNLLFYLKLLKDNFPNDVIVLPSYGIAWSAEGRAFLDEVLVDVRQRTGSKQTPWLFALSAGGPAGFSFYNDTPDQFNGLICLASCPTVEQAAILKPQLRVLMLNGSKDDRFPIEQVRATILPFRSRLQHFKANEIDSDHFFLLTASEETFRQIKSFMNAN